MSQCGTNGPNWNSVMGWTANPVAYQVTSTSPFINLNPFGTITIDVDGNSITYDSNGNPISLLENERESKMNEDSLHLENSEIHDVRSILSLIYNSFYQRSPFLNCFFYAGSQENKICFHYMHSLPIFRLSLFKDGSSNVCFVSDWSSDIRLYDGWDIVPIEEPDKVSSRKKLKNSAKSVFVIPSVSEINIYEWGFEILNNGGIQLIAMLNFATEEKPDHTLGMKNWKPPFKKSYMEKESFSKIVAHWKRI